MTQKTLDPASIPSVGEFSRPLLEDPALSGLERLYIRLFGVPIQGLRIRARYLLPVLARFRGAGFERVADAGSGRGLFTLHLARLFPDAEVVGMDISQDQVDRNNAVARSLGYENCRFMIQDVTRLDAAANYDFILSTDNLEHLEEDRAQCGIFFRALKPGGRILFHVPHLTRNLFGFKRENFMGIEGHVRPGYTIPGLSAMLRETGFEIEEALHSYTSIETLMNDVSYLITGGHEKRKALYALAFPFLMLFSQLGRFGAPPREGSGVIILARRPADADRAGPGARES